MIKRKLSFVERKYTRDNQLAAPMSAALVDECKRLWQYTLVIQREACLANFLLSSQISHAQVQMNLLKFAFKKSQCQISNVITDFLTVFHAFSH